MKYPVRRRLAAQESLERITIRIAEHDLEGAGLPRLPGRARLRAAVLDGRPLSETELVVRSANLLLDELHAFGRRRE